ncbi:uncharacterized protein LOC106153412 [Lingula anatina]|uniref:Uncharacterized protein LOC106153412 n=1 Tax=Lingula anatina TaxID=7574 RepID=A0A1S3H9U2_LINAN|nr:uncharacterized protein LOC106153412 [Lingula anatina]|eukprot:XP_013382787.1 uncharacterized protein LOC106153412 [Lingula anatina]
MHPPVLFCFVCAQVLVTFSLETLPVVSSLQQLPYQPQDDAKHADDISTNDENMLEDLEGIFFGREPPEQHHSLYPVVNQDTFGLYQRFDKRRDFMGKRNAEMSKRNEALAKRRDFIGKRRDFMGKRRSFMGRRSEAEDFPKSRTLSGKKSGDDAYALLLKKNRGFMGKRTRGFMGKRINFQVTEDTGFDTNGENTSEGRCRTNQDCSTDASCCTLYLPWLATTQCLPRGNEGDVCVPEHLHKPTEHYFCPCLQGLRCDVIGDSTDRGICIRT